MKKIAPILDYICILLAVIILVDFAISKTTVIERITSKQILNQSYNNAGGNSHLSFSIVTENNHFNCSESFFNILEDETLININRSLIFNKVNSYKNTNTNQKETYSLRYTTGLFIPIIVLILLILSLAKPNISDILKFITKVVIVADLAYLIFS